MATNKGNAEGTTRRGFIAACGVVAAAAALPIQVSASDPTAPASVLDGVRRWYDATLDAIVRGWEQRFRHRQYRPYVDGDWNEEHEVPRDEFEHALAQLPILRDEATACLVLAASAQTYDDAGSTQQSAVEVMAKDALDRAERMGYFATSCPEALRFPDLPFQEDTFDDFRQAEREVESARNCLAMVSNARDGVFSAEDRAAERKRLEAAEQHLAAIRAGKVPAFTAAQKAARQEAVRRDIVLAYKARLVSAGQDVSWVEVPPYWRAAQIAEEARS
jgi:hypothetical protein